MHHITSHYISATPSGRPYSLPVGTCPYLISFHSAAWHLIYLFISERRLNYCCSVPPIGTKEYKSSTVLPIIDYSVKCGAVRCNDPIRCDDPIRKFLFLLARRDRQTAYSTAANWKSWPSRLERECTANTVLHNIHTATTQRNTTQQSMVTNVMANQ